MPGPLPGSPSRLERGILPIGETKFGYRPESGADREVVLRAYSGWEIELVNQMASDDDQ